MMRFFKTLVLTLITASSFLMVPVAVHAVDVITPVCDGTNGIENSPVCKDDLTKSGKNPLFGPEGILTTAINIISIVIAIVATIIIIIAAIKLIVSQGNPQAITNARNQIIYSAVGIAVAAMAQGLVAFVLKKLT